MEKASESFIKLAIHVFKYRYKFPIYTLKIACSVSLIQLSKQCIKSQGVKTLEFEG